MRKQAKSPPEEKSPAHVAQHSVITDHDVYLFKEASHYRLYRKLGAHIMTVDGVEGTQYAIWAPNAGDVSVIGDFNGWNKKTHRLYNRGDGSGIWEGFIPGIKHGEVYKYFIRSQHKGYSTERGDPFGYHWETAPRTASVVWDLQYEWNDREWVKQRAMYNSLDSAISIYEVHIGSWMRVLEEGNRHLGYREIADPLARYVKEMGYTHVEFLPVMEHPFYGSWGYQITGYFAPTSRYGTPQDFMYLIDHLHQNGIGVILDWVPSHFPGDEHGLAFFDGTHLFEHSDPRKGFHPDWNSYIFNYDRNEVRAFLISNALYWLDVYHIDGLRVDAVASMLYLDYSRKEGEWIPNFYGGNENIGAITFLKRFNEVVYENYPDVQTIAEESTAWPMVSRPVYVGGLGFGMKWNMGWMHDTLQYFSKDPVHRKYHHNELTFSLIYAFNENFTLPLSHDEVVHGKGSLLAKMPGDDWQKFANLRALYGYMFGHPGKKLIFMGGEFGQWKEWKHDDSIEWNLLQYKPHRGLQTLLKDLNSIYRNEPSLYEHDFLSDGFEWIDFHDWEGSTISFLRRGISKSSLIIVVCNLTPVPRSGYRIGVPKGGYWKEILNTDAVVYGGSGMGNMGGIYTENEPSHGRDYSITLTVPPLSVVFLKYNGSVTQGGIA